MDMVKNFFTEVDGRARKIQRYGSAICSRIWSGVKCLLRVLMYGAIVGLAFIVIFQFANILAIATQFAMELVEGWFAIEPEVIAFITKG